jgi:hypothetical protein
MEGQAVHRDRDDESYRGCGAGGAHSGELTFPVRGLDHETGPVLLSGDLYHYPEEMTYERIPSFDFDMEQNCQAPGHDRGVRQEE